MALSEIVNVSIQAGTVSPARTGFGTPLILAHHSVFDTDEVRTYTTFSGLAADFASDAADERHVNLAGAAIFSQSPRPTSVKVACAGVAPLNGQEYTLDFTDHSSGSAITGSITGPDGTAYTINVAWNTSIALTLADLETAVEAFAGGALFTVDDSGSPVATVSATAGNLFEIEITSSGCTVRETSDDFDYDDALDDVLLVDADWYAVIVPSNSPKNIDKVARWALANDRLAAFAPHYTDPSEFVSGEFTSGADYTALLANDAALGVFTANPRSSFVEAAWLGKMLPTDPGSATWAFKSLAGVGADSWTPSQRTTIEGKGGNHYATEAAIDITRPGKMFGGEWIDVVIGLAWLEARIQEGQFSLLVNNPKIPYTDAGISLVVADLRRVLTIAEDRGVLAPGWVINAPTAASQDAADRAARILRDVEFEATLQGAVHMINVVGTVTV